MPIEEITKESPKTVGALSSSMDCDREPCQANLGQRNQELDNVRLKLDSKIDIR